MRLESLKNINRKVKFSILVLVIVVSGIISFDILSSIWKILSSNSGAITNIAGIASLLTAIIMFLTLREMQIERKNSYKPDPVLQTRSCSIYCQSFNQGPKKGRYVSFRFLEEDLLGATELAHVFGSEDSSLFSIPLVNIGLGTAKKIECNWNFDADEFSKKIQKIDMEKRFRFSVKDDFLSINIYGEPHSSSSIQMQRKFEYILPINIDKSNSSLTIPPAFLEMLGVMTHLLSICPHEILSKIPDYTNIPELELEIKYTDIQNIKYFKKLKVKFNLVSFVVSGKIEGTSNIASGCFEVDYTAKP